MTASGCKTVSGRVSVIVPTYNRAQLIGDTLASIAAVNWRDVEVIIADDGSTDDTSAVITRMREQGYRWPVIYFWQENSGPAAARNAGHKRMSGEFVYHLDSDDTVSPDAFAQLIAEIERSGAPYAVGQVSDAIVTSRDEQSTNIANHKILPGDVLFSTWYTHAALYRREVVARAGGYNTALRAGEDTEFHWRIIVTSGLPAQHAGIVAKRHVHDHEHLGYFASKTASHHSMLNVYEAFFAACPDEFNLPINVWRIFAFGIASGRMADTHAKTRTQALMAAIADKRPRSRLVRLFRLLLRPRLRLYFFLLETGIRATRWALRKTLALLPKPVRRAAKSALRSQSARLAHP